MGSGFGPSPEEAEIPIFRKEQKNEVIFQVLSMMTRRIKAPVYVNRQLGSGIYFVHSFVPGLLTLICPTVQIMPTVFNKTL